MPARLLCLLAVALLAAAYIFSACDRQKDQSTSTTTVRTGPPSTSPAIISTQPASRPTFSILTINGQELRFPPARLMLQQVEPYIEVQLFSDDPKDALGSRYDGNRYYFDLKLTPGITLDQLGSADFQYQNPSTERVDSPDGIYLEGDRKHLQPTDWRCAFSRQGGIYLIHIEGQFLLFPARDEQAVPQKVQISGLLAAELESKKSRRTEPTTRPASPR